MNIAMPTPLSESLFFDASAGITVQLHQSNGDCYETVFGAEQVLKNDGTQVRAKK